MPKYMRPAVRFAILLVLVAALMMIRPTTAAAFTCETDCVRLRTNCLNLCQNHPPIGATCSEFCQVPYDDCLADC